MLGGVSVIPWISVDLGGRLSLPNGWNRYNTLPISIETSNEPMITFVLGALIKIKIQALYPGIVQGYGLTCDDSGCPG